MRRGGKKSTRKGRGRGMLEIVTKRGREGENMGEFRVRKEYYARSKTTLKLGKNRKIQIL